MSASTAFKLFAILTGGISATFAAGTSQAQSTATVMVRTGDLDLSTAAGERKLRLRLIHAVSETCPIGARCREAALSRAYEQAAKLVAAAKSGAATPEVLRVTAR